MQTHYMRAWYETRKSKTMIAGSNSLKGVISIRTGFDIDRTRVSESTEE